MTFSTSVAPLRYAPFRSLWLASVASNAGSFVQTVAASWLMQELTGSPSGWRPWRPRARSPPLPRPPRRGTRRHPRSAEGDAGVPGGDGDRRHRHGSARLPRVAQPTAPAWAGAAARGGGRLQPPRMAGHGSRPRPPQLVANAVALNSVAFNVARAVGPALGGLLVAPPAPGGPFSSTASPFWR